MPELFRVVWASTGKPVTHANLEAIAPPGDLGQGTDLLQHGGVRRPERRDLILLDECGRHVYLPAELFRVECLRPA